jgi:polyphenol oxidase
MIDPLFYINDERFIAFTSTRSGGVSHPPFDSLNLAFHTGDDPELVKHNRQLLFSYVGLNPDHIVYTNQSHSDVIKEVTKEDLGKGNQSFTDGIPADALYTKDSSIPLAIFHADCVPVVLIHKYKPLVCVIHAGTTGTLHKITFKSIQHLVKVEHIDPKDFFVYVGPSLDFAHHPIDVKRVDEIVSIDQNYAQAIKLISGQFYLDVPLLNYIQLIDAGIDIEKIHMSQLDTFTAPADYFSYDREKTTGRHITVVAIK